MRVSFFLSSLTLSGGVEAVMEYANRLAGRGHRISLVTPGGTVDPALARQLDGRVLLVESRAALTSRRNPLRHLWLALSMVAAAPPADVLVATHTPTVVPALLAARLRGKGRPVWLYMDYAEMFRGRPIELWLLKHAPPWFAHVIAISEAGRWDAQRNANVQATVVHLGLFRPEQLLGRRLPLPPSPRRVMYVGDSRPRKGLRDFLAAAEQVFRQMPDLKLVIVSKEQCQIQTPVPFEFHHFPSRRALGDLYRRCHLFVSASWAEGFGYPPLEAMACGTPVVLTNSRGVLDFARSGENCLMVPPRQPDALAEAMLRVLADPALAERFAAAGLQTAQRFDWRTSVEKLEAILLST